MLGPFPDEARAVLVRQDQNGSHARLDDGTEVRVRAAASDHRLVVGMRVVLWRLHESAGKVEAERVELDDEHRQAYEALLLRAIEEEALARARAERKPPQAPLLPGQHGGVVEDDPEGRKSKQVRLDDGRVARCWSRSAFRAIPGVRVLVRRTEMQRGELWIAEMERDEAHRDDYERLLAPERFASELEDQRRRLELRGEVVTDRPGRVMATVVAVDRRAGVLHLDDATRVEFGPLSCDGFDPAAGMRVMAGRFRLRSGVLFAEDVTIDAATREATRAARRARREPSAPAEPALEAAILDRPDDPAPLAAYEAWLRERGDVRADLIAVERDLETAPERGRAELETRRRDLVDRSAGFLLGALADPASGMELTFRRGFIRSARVLAAPGAPASAERVRALLELPTARLLTELHVAEAEGAVLRALRDPPSRSLERLVLGDDPEGELGAIPKLGRWYPRLRDLELAGREPELDAGALPTALRRLVIRSTHLGRAALAAIMAGPWPALEELVLWLGHDPADRRPITAQDLAPLLGGVGVPKLTALGLCNTVLGNAIARELPGSALLAQLRRLDLSLGTMTDGGAAAIGAAAPAFAAIAELDARGNLLTALGEGYLREAVASARTEGQRKGYGERRREVGVAP